MSFDRSHHTSAARTCKAGIRVFSPATLKKKFVGHLRGCTGRSQSSAYQRCIASKIHAHKVCKQPATWLALQEKKGGRGEGLWQSDLLSRAQAQRASRRISDRAFRIISIWISCGTCGGGGQRDAVCKLEAFHNFKRIGRHQGVT
jgi:hypothetical protein